ncbi:MAG: alpha/beta fold hydrolase [Candidatus Eisenbacteria bacterium]|nr:alpha/beta fold hydrolase [Candidatus Eisenbacteria bacterium]
MQPDASSSPACPSPQMEGREMSQRSLLLFALPLLSLACQGSTPPAGDAWIDVGTHRLHIHCEGEGQPPIIVDVGVGSSGEQWAALRRELAEVSRICTYDRAGYGESEAGPFPRDAGTVADELHALLRGAALPPPYLLVGHSLGGLHVQVYAARHPDEVAGLVLLDPPPLGWLRGESYPRLREMLARMTNEWQAQADRLAQSSDSAGQAQSRFLRTIASEHREMTGRSAAQVAAIETFGDIPLTVIASGVPNPLFGQIAEAYQRYWIEQSRKIATRSVRGEFILAEQSAHHLHRDAPHLVREAIEEMVREVRAARAAGTK